MIELRTPAEIEEMRAAGRFVAETLATLRDETKVGTNLLSIDRRAHDMIRKAGAESCYIDYHPSFGASPFGKVICTSVNDAVLHGLPHDYALRDGDLVTLDFAVSVDGWVADSAVSFVVGTPRDEDLRLIDTTERALTAAIQTSTVGNRIGDISAAIAAVAHGEGYSINTDFGGHGVGRTMHGDPHVANDGRAGRGFRNHASDLRRVQRETIMQILDAVDAASRCARDSCSPWSRGSSPRPTSSSRTPTAGPCAARTARGARIPSTRSRSPRTARSF